MPATAEPTLTYTLDANTIRDSAVSRRSFDPFRSPGARFDFMGRLPSGFGRSLKTVPEIDSTIGGTSTTRGNGSRGVSGSSCHRKRGAPKRKGYTSTSALFASKLDGVRIFRWSF